MLILNSKLCNTLLEKKYFRRPVLVLQVVTKEESIQYLEEPNTTWKDHDRNLGVQTDKIYSYHGPSRYYLV